MTVQPSSAGSEELIERMETFADHGCSPNDLQMAQELVADALLVVRSRSIAQCSPQPVCDLCDAPLMCAACGHEQRPAHAQAEPEPRWRHKKRGTSYTEIGRGELQAEPSADLCEGDRMVAYRGDDGRVWFRREEEFEDGRFEALQGTPVQPTQGAPKTIMEAAASAADKISLWSNSKQGYANRIVPQPTQGGDKGEPRWEYSDGSLFRDGVNVFHFRFTETQAELIAELVRDAYAAPQPASNAYTAKEPSAWIDAAALQAAHEIVALSESWTYTRRKAAIQVIVAREMARAASSIPSTSQNTPADLSDCGDPNCGCAVGLTCPRSSTPRGGEA